MKLLFLTNDLNTVNGITTFLFQESKVLLEKYDYEIFILHTGGDAAYKFEKLGVKLFDKGFLSFEKRTPLNFLKSIIYCFWVFIKYRIDIVSPQIHYSAAYSYYPSLLLKRAYIQTVHNVVDKFDRLKPLYGKHFFAISNSISKNVLSYNINANVKIVRCPFEGEKEKVTKAGKIKIVSAGRLTRDKGFDVFIEAISGLDEETRGFAQFYIIGSGELVKELKEFKRKLNVEVEFIDALQEIEDFYKTSHIFVMSTRNRNEGLGLVIIEAALKRNLIISPSYPSIDELLVNGTDGFLFNMGNSTELSKILENVILNYNELKILADNFYLKVREEFSYDTNGKIFNEVYSSLV